MKFFWNISRKNLTRNKLRTTVSIIAIAISVAVVVFTRGLITGFIDNTFSLTLKYDTGHIKIVNEEYRQKERLLSLSYPVDGFEGEGVSSMAREMEELEGIEMAIPRIKFGAMASIDDEMVSMLGWGIDPAKEDKFIGLKDKLISGRIIKPGQREILVGQGLLSKLGKEVGDKVTLLYTNSFSSFKGTTFKIVGAMEGEIPLLNERIFYLPLDVAQEILIMPEQSTELLLVTPSAQETGEYFPGVEKLLEEKGAQEKYSALPWDEANAMLQYMQIAVRIYDVIYIFLVLLSSIVVINTMLMIVKERTREIGMMTALGLKGRDVLKLFIMEGTIMGIIGSFLGAIIGGIITRVASVHGLSYGKEAFEAMEEGLMMNPVIYPNFDISHMVFAFVLGVIVTSLTCIYPASRAARLQPTDALRDL